VVDGISKAAPVPCGERRHGARLDLRQPVAEGIGWMTREQLLFDERGET
jgi:hypothetical protein